jgi:transcriptional regulator with XRE-family HTH domain
MATMSPATERAVQAWAGNVLRVARAKKGLSQRDLARAAGVPPSTIAKIESGQRQPTHPTLAKILASVGLALTTRVEPYDDHDDVLWAGDHERSAEQRAAIAAEQERVFIRRGG